MSEHELRPDAASAANETQNTTIDAAPSQTDDSAAAAELPSSSANSQSEASVHEDVTNLNQPLAEQQTVPTPAQTQPVVEPQPFEKIELPPAEEKPAPVVVTDELLARLRDIMEKGETVTVHVAQRIRGGLRVLYEGVKMFLPSSQFFLKKSPTNDELQAAVGTDIPVHIAEITKDESGRISIIVTRQNILRNEFYSRIAVGNVVEGTITAVKEFGLFVDIGGFDGLVHITRVSHRPPAHLAEMFHIGDRVRAQIIEIDPASNKISLSMKALESSPWHAVAERYKPGERYQGVVRRLVPFGSFVELEPGIEGLLRLRELSWTRRISDPAEVLREGQQIDVVVIEVKPDREEIDLSLRQTTENPWPSFVTKYPRGLHTTGIVREVKGAGVLLTIGGEVDAFMPRSHMRPVLKGKRIPYAVGDIVAVTVVEVDPTNESFIVEPRVEPEEELFGPPRDARAGHASKQQEQRQSQRPSNPTRITIGEMLSEEERQRLFGRPQ
ncbi:MAG: S1 RNA-binding domain-containing protein [Chlorobi bacterium]|nr:S1 RNA-binding domain-containing protein [Chlorobiota bacterium]